METRSFDAIANTKSCDGCSAACCRMLIFPHPQPQTFLDIDYLRYMLGFPGVEVQIDSDGSWSIAVLRDCRHLDPDTHRCTIHQSPSRPRICESYQADQCWYHRNFVSERPPELVRLDTTRFEQLLPLLRFDDTGRIVQAPNWEELRQLAGSDGPDRVPGWPAPDRSSAPHDAMAVTVHAMKGPITARQSA